MPQSFAEQLRSIPMSPNLGQSLERAHRSARDQSHRLVTLEHLLLALVEDAEAALILQSANVDLGRLGTDVSSYLGGLLEDMRAEPGTEPRPDPELLRVLQAAASAAQQSKRKQIDGAIVLAAIVGDGKSPAAGLLKALGMTFEEAIRALQRANTKARLKPLARAPSSSPAEGPTDAAPAAARAPADAKPSSDASDSPDDVPITEPGASSLPQPLGAQSADEILAAARARIQKRSAATAKTEPVTLREAPATSEQAAAASLVADTDPEIEPIDPSQTKSLTAAIEAAMTPATAPTKAESALPPTGRAADVRGAASAAAAVAPARPAWTPPPEPRPSPRPEARAQSPVRLVQPAVAPAAPVPPFPARPLQPHEGPRRPPLPHRPAGQAQPQQPAFAARPQRAPWPEPTDHGEGVVRPQHANGSYAELPLAPQRTPERPGPPRGVPQGEKGLLVEAVPRRMHMGVPAAAEVRIARNKLDGLLQALNVRDPRSAGDALLLRALSVRLRAPKGGFWIEATTPETHWIEGAEGRAEDEFITWTWTVVPRRRGRNRLTLTVSAHTAGRDGAPGTSSPPDRVIDVSVGPNHMRRMLRAMGWVTAALVGAGMAHFGSKYAPLISAVFRKTFGG
jgi:neural Wiskott-Aldrich syndrome protein